MAGSIRYFRFPQTPILSTSGLTFRANHQRNTRRLTNLERISQLRSYIRQRCVPIMPAADVDPNICCAVFSIGFLSKLSCYNND